MPRFSREGAGFVAFVLLVGGLLAVSIVAASRGALSVQGIRGFVERGGVWSPVVYVVAASVLPLAWVPRGALTTVAGALFGFWWGSVLALAGGLGGALAGYAVARLLGHAFVARRAGRRGERVLDFVARRGFLAIVTGRICPVLSCEMVSLASGLAAVPMRTYLAASVVGMLPGSFLFAALGASLVEAESWWITFGTAIGAVLLGMATVLLLRRWWRLDAAARGSLADGRDHSQAEL